MVQNSEVPTFHDWVETMMMPLDDDEDGGKPIDLQPTPSHDVLCHIDACKVVVPGLIGHGPPVRIHHSRVLATPQQEDACYPSHRHAMTMVSCHTPL